MSNLHALGAHMLRARTLYAVDLEALATDISVAPEHLRAVERGEVKPPPFVLEAYAERFRMDLSELKELAG